MAVATSGTVIDLAGRVASDLIGPALLGGLTLREGMIGVLPGTKNFAYLPLIGVGSLLQNDGATFNASGNVTMSQRVLTLEPLRVNLTGNYSTFESMTSLASGALNTELPYEQRVMQVVAEKAGTELDHVIWQGVTATAGQFDGFATIAAASVTGSTGVIGVTGTTLTSSNFIAQLILALTASPVAVRQDKADCKIFISLADEVAFNAALTAANLNTGNAYADGVAYKFMGYDVYAVDLAAGDIMIARKSNMWFATDRESDQNEARMIDLRKTTGDNQFRIIMRMMGAVGFGNLDEVVYYS